MRGHRWRLAGPSLEPARKAALVPGLMAARRALRKPAGDPEAVRAARARVDAAKRALGERGPVWWDDGAPDDSRCRVADTSYAGWFAAFGTSIEAGTRKEIASCRVR